MTKIRVYSDNEYSFLVESFAKLQEYHIQIDPYKRLIKTKIFAKQYANKCLEDMKKRQGILFIAFENTKPVGFIAGEIWEQQEHERSKVIPTKTGRIEWIYISEKYRGKHIGTKLIERIEKYFQKENCTISRLNVFMTNLPAIKLYKKLQYNPLCLDLIKNLSHD